MFGLGTGELLLILFIALIFIGPKKLPELARGLGRGIREFQKAKDDFMDEMKHSDHPAEPQKNLPKGVNDTAVADSHSHSDHHSDVHSEAHSEIDSKKNS